MKVLPILFNTDMVQAILDGRKTVTRRVIKDPYYIEDEEACRGMGFAFHKGTAVTHGMPYPDVPYNPGDILYVRETWSTRPSNHCYAQPCHGSVCPHESCDLADSPCFPEEYIYKASDSLPVYGGKWRPSIHMPKEAARIFLRVTDVRVERLQEITADGTRAEGVDASYSRVCGNGEAGNVCDFSIERFETLWDSTINPANRHKYGWEANPWVWAITFERCEKPEEVKP